MANSLSQTDPQSVSTGNVALFTALLLVDSLHFVFARALLPHISPLVSAMYVIGIATVQVGVYGALRRAVDWRLARHHLPFFLSIGFLVGASTVMNYASVAFIDAGTASMLGKMTTLWTMLFGIIWLRESLSRRQLAGAALALAGVFVITFQPADYLRLGSLLIVGSTFMYALHAAIVKRYGGDMNFMSFFFYRLLFTTAFLFLFAVGSRSLAWPTPTAWLILLLAGTVDVTISRGLYYTGLRRLPITLFAIILTLSPVIAVGWSRLLFGTFPSVQQLLGGMTVLVGVLFATFPQQRTSRK